MTTNLEPSYRHTRGLTPVRACWWSRMHTGTATALPNGFRDDIAPKVAADVAYQNARENTPHRAHGARPGAR